MKIIIATSFIFLSAAAATVTAGSMTAESKQISAVKQQDPMDSVMWDYTRAKFLGNAPYMFDDAVKVSVPAHAEDPTQVPVLVDATAFDGKIVRIVSWSDLNPIHHIFTYYSHPNVASKVSLKIKVQQATPVRAAVLTDDGVWHVGSAWVDAAGGGCTTPSMATGSALWESALGQIQYRQFSDALTAQTRYKLRVIHPMDTGLADGIPEFYIEHVELRNQVGVTLARMELSQPVSENPVFTFDVKEGNDHHIWMRDNGGNEFESSLSSVKKVEGV